MWSIEQNEGAKVWNRTALVKDGQGTLVINQNTEISHSFVVREGTMVIKDAALTNTTPLESPSLTVGGTHAHLVLDGGSYEQTAGYVSAVVIGGRDGDGTLTLMNGAEMSNPQGIFAGYLSGDPLVATANPNEFTAAHVAGTYVSTNEEEADLYRDLNPDLQFSSDYTYAGESQNPVYMSKAAINILSGSSYNAGTAVYLVNAVVNIKGEGSLLHVGSRSPGQDSNIGVSFFSDGGRYQPAVVVNVSEGACLRMDCELGDYQDMPTSRGVLYLGYGSASGEINVSGAGSSLEIQNRIYCAILQNGDSTISSAINITDQAVARLDKVFMGDDEMKAGSSHIYVDAASTYEGEHVILGYGAVFINEGSTSLKGISYYAEDWIWNAETSEMEPQYEWISSALTVANGGVFVNAAGASLEVGDGGGFTLEDGGRLVNYGEISQLESQQAVTCVVDENSVLENYGTIGVNVENYGTMLGSGKITAAYTATSGSVTYIGTPVLVNGALSAAASQPGAMHVQTFSADSGSKLVFFVDGDVAATEQNAGAGTYSNISVANSGLTVKEPGSVSADLVLGSRAFKTALSREDKAIPLQLVSEQAESADGAATDRTLELDLEYALSGERAELFSVDETGMLHLVLSPDAVTAATVYGAVDLLNSLWTSTGMVQDFARKALMTQTPARLSFAQPRHPEGSEHVTGIDLWGSGLGYFSNMGGAQGFDFNSGGYAVGCDAELLSESTQSARVGLAFGQSFGTFKSDIGSKVDQEALMFALYGGAERKLSDRTSLYLGAYAAYGRVDNDARTRFMEGSAGYADWDDDVWSFGLQAELNFKVSDYFTVSPFTGIDYVYGSHGSFLEDFGDGLRRSYSSGSMQVWRVPVGVRLSTMVELGGNQVLLPELSVAYVGDVSRSNPHATVDVAGSKARVHGSNPGRSALMLQAGATWIINDRWSTGAAYHLEARSGQTAQGLNAYVRYRF